MRTMYLPVPPDEADRLRLLDRLGLLDTARDAVFDEIARLAGTVCDAPISLVSFVGAFDQAFRARLGLSVSGTSRCVSFCAHAICHRELFVIPDTHLDPRFADNPLVLAEPHIRFYAGMPIVHGGVALGTVCVADQRPRELHSLHATMLRSLAVRAGEHIAAVAARRENHARGPMRAVTYRAG